MTRIIDLLRVFFATVFIVDFCSAQVELDRWKVEVRRGIALTIEKDGSIVGDDGVTLSDLIVMVRKCKQPLSLGVGVYFREVNFKQDDVERLAGLHLLEFLTINSSTIATDASFLCFNRVQFLALKGTPITAEQLKQISNLPKLETLVLEDTGLQHATLRELRNCKSLKDVYLAGLDLHKNPDICAELQMCLPDTKLHFFGTYAPPFDLEEGPLSDD